MGGAAARPASAHGIRPFGIQAQRLLRLEKGHIIVSQDTDFETTPWRVDMGWAVKLEKDWFVGKRALVRKQEHADREADRLPRRDRLGKAPWEGAAVKVDGKLVGRVTTLVVLLVARLSDRARLGASRSSPPRASASLIGKDNMSASVVKGAFYDPEGAKLRA